MNIAIVFNYFETYEKVTVFHENEIQFFAYMMFQR